MMPFEKPQAEASQQVLAAIAAGLEAASAAIHPKYFYDTLGSRLFDAICARDFRAENDLLPALGLAGVSPAELHRQLREG